MPQETPKPPGNTNIDAATDAIEATGVFAPASAEELTGYLERDLPGLLDAMAAAISTVGHRLQQEHSVHPAVPEHLEEIAAGLAGVGEELARGVGPLYRDVHEKDLDRVENPSSARPGFWDVAINTGGGTGHPGGGSSPAGAATGGGQPGPTASGEYGGETPGGSAPDTEPHGGGAPTGNVEPGDTHQGGSGQPTLPEDVPAGQAPEDLDDSEQTADAQVAGGTPPGGGSGDVGGGISGGEGDDFIERGARYREQMDAIDEALSGGNTFREQEPIAESLPGYVTHGGTCYVYTTPDGNLMKLPRIEVEFDEDQNPENRSEPLRPDVVITEYVEPLLRQRGRPGLEQIVDYIPPAGENKGGVIVKDSGWPIGDLTPEELDSIPLEDFEGLINATCSLPELELGAEHELGTDNIVHKPGEGFTLIDLQILPVDAAERTPREVAENVTANFFVDTICRRSTPEELRRPFPNAGRRLFQAYRDKFGSEAAAALHARVQAGIEGARRVLDANIYDLPDDL